MKIIALIPVWKRPDILRITVPLIPEWLHPVYILSPEDPCYFENAEITKGHDRCIHQNIPVSDKQNAGLRAVLKSYDFDYLMNLGSDDVLNPNLIDLYKKTKHKFYGFNQLYFWEPETNTCVEYDCEMVYGAGRMIHRSIVEKMEGNIWPFGINKGMDTGSMNLIANVAREDVKPVKFHEPAVLDIKSETNINQIGFFKETGKIIDFETINKYFHVQPQRVLEQQRKADNRR